MPDELFGESAAAIGDFDLDGRGDLAIGAPRFGVGPGHVFVYRGTPQGLATTPAYVATAQSLGCFGCAVAGAGDLDGDGFPELAVGDQSLSQAFLYSLHTRAATSASDGPLDVRLTVALVSDGFELNLDWGEPCGPEDDYNVYEGTLGDFASHAPVSCGIFHTREFRLPAPVGAGRDVLLEKPMATTLAEADDLIALAQARQRVLQVGHIERFNPATEALLSAGRGARFVEVHRLGSCVSPRSLDVDVVLDLMVPDHDIVLALDGSDSVQIEAVGVPVLTPRVDIANARLRLASGLIANLTASRVSLEKVRKFRVFAPRTYVSADFGAREAQVFRLEVGGEGGPRIETRKQGAPDQEPLRLQIEAFLGCVRARSEPLVSGTDGRRALALALAILERMAEH